MATIQEPRSRRAIALLPRKTCRARWWMGGWSVAAAVYVGLTAELEDVPHEGARGHADRRAAETGRTSGTRTTGACERGVASRSAGGSRKAAKPIATAAARYRRTVDTVRVSKVPDTQSQPLVRPTRLPPTGVGQAKTTCSFLTRRSIQRAARQREAARLAAPVAASPLVPGDGCGLAGRPRKPSGTGPP